MSHPPARTDLACRNCGAQAPSKFCPDCGQETTLHPPTLGEFLHEFVGHYVALEGELWRTLWVLLRRPGRLTREYLDGRRRRYVLPLRLYLTASFLFFLVLKLTAGSLAPDTHVLVGQRQVTLAQFKAEAAAEAAAKASGATPATHHGPMERAHPNCGGASQPACGRIVGILDRGLAELQEHPQESMEHMRTHFLGWAPYAIFVLLPAFAGLMQLAYLGRRMTYGEHFVFSLHLHAFWFLALLVIALLPDSVSGIVWLAVPAYGTWAMRETYGGRWLPTVLRAVLVSVIYGVVLGVALLALGTALLASA
ncbi:DUF3667 domain-containing protein [Scleromatobacter humisilvae]|uniref:DUF3667 domain-containing protein n=1 Tax=Scleromatobacter humisilvae TaxID=2897159 RepID=A0A9X1YMI2_9BURK|nr:DUF3667 domain-containing protein [Scleromatobacter humisilvae]MCK9688185.1 DUF3667 domain-containing protein [Scleromatobacter humisilvae]